MLSMAAMLATPVTIQTLELSIIGPGQHIDGRLQGNSWVRNLILFRREIKLSNWWKYVGLVSVLGRASPNNKTKFRWKSKNASTGINFACVQLVRVAQLVIITRGF